MLSKLGLAALTVVLSTPGRCSAADLLAFKASLDRSAKMPVNILVLGDSISSCYRTNKAAGDSPCPDSPADRWPDRVGAKLKAKYGDHGSGFQPVDNGPLNDLVWSNTGGYKISSFSGAGQSAIAEAWQLIEFTGGAFVESIGIKADSVFVYCASGPGAGAIRVLIDGVAAGTACGLGSTVADKRVAFPVMPGIHRLKLMAPVKGVGYVYGAEWSVGRSGVAIQNVARAGARSEWFAADRKMAWIDLIPDVRLVVIALGANDYLQAPGVAPNETQANLRTIVRHLKAHGNPPLLVVGEGPSGGWGMNVGARNKSGHPQSEYISAARKVAEEEGAAWLSLYDRYHGAPAFALQAGLINKGDKTHPTNAGAADMAVAILEKILAP